MGSPNDQEHSSKMKARRKAGIVADQSSSIRAAEIWKKNKQGGEENSHLVCLPRILRHGCCGCFQPAATLQTRGKPLVRNKGGKNSTAAQRRKERDLFAHILPRIQRRCHFAEPGIGAASFPGEILSRGEKVVGAGSVNGGEWADGTERNGVKVRGEQLGRGTRGFKAQMRPETPKGRYCWSLCCSVLRFSAFPRFFPRTGPEFLLYPY